MGLAITSFPAQPIGMSTSTQPAIGFQNIRTGPPAELQAFLAAGTPPVFIGFGSMPLKDPHKTTNIILAALKQTGVVVISRMARHIVGLTTYRKAWHDDRHHTHLSPLRQSKPYKIRHRAKRQAKVFLSIVPTAKPRKSRYERLFRTPARNHPPSLGRAQ